MSNHPDFVGIIPILLENPESRRNFGRDRKIPILNPGKLFSSNKQGNEIYLTWIWVKVKVWTKKTANKNPLPSVSGCIAFCARSFSFSNLPCISNQRYNVNTKREMTINLPNLFLTEILFYVRVLEIVFQGVEVANISGDPLVFLGFALGWPLCGQKSRWGTCTVQRLDTLNCINNNRWIFGKSEDLKVILTEIWFNCIVNTQIIYS